MKYFTIEELTRSDTAARLGIDNTPGATEKANLTALIENVLDPLRAAWGAPIVVSSGYRCARLNKAVGGAASSQHQKGQAADIHAVSNTGRDNKALLRLLLKLGLPYDQVISEYPNAQGEPKWIHVSHVRGGKQRGNKLTCVGGRYWVGIKL